MTPLCFRLLYFRKIQVPANKQVEISVPFVESNWQRQDGQLANREHLMMALGNLDALLVKATFTTSTREALYEQQPNIIFSLKFMLIFT